MKRIHLDFDKRAYDICIAQDFALLADEVKKLNASKILIITDSNVSKLYLKEVYDILKGVCTTVASAQFAAGEMSKNLATIQRLYEACVQNGLDRKSVIVALGGGVVGDMAGFVAASFMRGIRFVQIPTTLLAQTDSSVGGKVGVDFAGYKNIIGAFKQPALVYINAQTLKSLPPREFAAGMGEVIKYGIIRDAAFLDYLKANAQRIRSFATDEIETVLEKCCRIKADVVEQDETEGGLRAILNFGHTVGHAIESAKDFSLLHGECVGLGMICALSIAQERGWVSQADVEKVRELLAIYDIKTQVDGLSVDTVADFMMKDKKVENGVLKFVLAEPMGNAKIVTDVTKQELSDAIKAVLV